MIYANYHTHTTRCHHATGTERDYVEHAIAAGMKVLGFSDHAPYVFEGDYYSNFRMRPEELESYVGSILALREEYKDQIQILIGLEAEYYPKHFAQFLKLLEPWPIDYLIHGQHALNNEYDGVFSGGPEIDEKWLCTYVEQVTEGLKTGKFSYLAHPDLIRWQGDDVTYRREMEKLCVTAKELNIPLELNLLGLREGRHYPCDRFYAIAGEVGNEVLIACDAHSPEVLHHPEAERIAREMAARHNLKLIQEVKLIKP